MVNIELIDTAKIYIDKLKSFAKNDFDIHKNNLITKLDNTLKSKKSASFVNSNDVKLFVDPYIQYRSNVEKLFNAINEDNLYETQGKLVDEFSEYKDKVRLLNINQYFTSQSKYEPSILEEFIGFFLNPLINNFQGAKCGPVNAYVEMGFNVNIENYTNTNKNIINTNLAQKTKVQDFSIYIEDEISINSSGQNIKIQLPIISIECKTYIDKTMLEGSISTAKRIKNGNPKSKFYIIAETYELAGEVSQHEIDNIFVIRKCNRHAKTLGYIDVEVFRYIYSIINTNLNDMNSNISQTENIKKIGRIKI